MKRWRSAPHSRLLNDQLFSATRSFCDIQSQLKKLVTKPLIRQAVRLGPATLGWQDG
jgi:hypothetical protein